MPQDDNKNTNQQPASTHQKREHPSTYFVQDRSNLDEIARLLIADEMVTRGMGGVLPEQADPAHFQSVLDVGSGIGGWLIALAKQYPTIKRLVGIDISAKMVEYAREQAVAQGVGDRVEFAVMDALRLLEFPDSSFDLVNQRFGMSYLRKWDWPNILREHQRVCKMGGIIRITEADLALESARPNVTRLYALLAEAFYQAGHLFTPAGDGVITELARVMQQYGISGVQIRSYALQAQQGTSEGKNIADGIRLTFQNATPFLRKWTRVPDDYDALFQQALTEIQQPDFVSTTHLLTAWGTNSVRKTSKAAERD